MVAATTIISRTMIRSISRAREDIDVVFDAGWHTFKNRNRIFLVGSYKIGPFRRVCDNIPDKSLGRGSENRKGYFLNDVALVSGCS